MGIDFLDCMFQVEKEFGIPQRAFNLDKLEAPRKPNGTLVDDVTAEQMLRWVEVTLRDNGRPIPDDCWPRLRVCIAETAAVPVEEVTLQSGLKKDLGFT